MKKIDIRKATASLAEYARETIGEPLVVTVAGKPVAALVPVHGMDMESLSLSTNGDFLAIIERSRRSLQTKGGTSLEEVQRRFGEKRVKRKA